MWWQYIGVWFVFVVLTFLLLKVEKVFYETTSGVWGCLTLLFQTVWTFAVIGMVALHLYIIALAIGIPL